MREKIATSIMKFGRREGGLGREQSEGNQTPPEEVARKNHRSGGKMFQKIFEQECRVCVAPPRLSPSRG